ncbi:MAG: hypothetical protein IJT23_07590 [Clostridia bacterium]|nr:hypothetical protein [Clostridia bacterium]
MKEYEMTDKQFDSILLDSIFDLIDIRDNTTDENTKKLANEKIKRLEIKLRCEHGKYSINL